MTTKAEQITDAIFAILEAEPILVDGNVWRSRLRPIKTGTDFAIVLRGGPDIRGSETTLNRHSRELNLTVEVYARGDVPDQLADPKVELVIDRVLADRTLAGLCDDIQIGNKVPSWETRDTELVVIDLQVIVDYEQSNDSL